MSITHEISEFLQKGRAKNVKALVQQALDEGVSASEILNDGLLAGMSVVGAKFKTNEIFVPEVLIAARALNAGEEQKELGRTEAGDCQRSAAVGDHRSRRGGGYHQEMGRRRHSQ